MRLKFSVYARYPALKIRSRNVNIHPCNRAERSCRENPGNKIMNGAAFAVPPVVVGPVIASVGRVVKIDMHYYYMYKT